MFGKAVVGILMVTLLSFPIARTASADVDGWEAAGLVLAGAVGYAILSDIADGDNHSRHYRGVPVVYERRPSVRVYHTRPSREWVPGHCEIETEKVWVPGYYDKVWVPPVTQRVWVSGRRGRGYWEEEVIRPGHYKKVWRQGYYEYREVEVWVEGHWEYN